MNKFVLIAFVLMLFALAPIFSDAQAPQGFKYQSIARNSSGQPIASSTIGLRISIHDLTETGTVVYSETHVATTSLYGSFTVTVGTGVAVSGDFSSIQWGVGAKFMEVEADFNGGTAYTSMGTSPLLSVPYALYAENTTPGPAGTDGLSILNGTTDPAEDVGTDGEFYINTSTHTLFGPKTSGVWPSGILLIGASGSDGANGLSILNGSTDPTGDVGVDGEFYINTSTHTLFGPKSSGTWPAGTSLMGPSGTSGSDGVDGLNVLHGTTDPADAIGVDGEFYINTSTHTLFGPKSSGTWPAGTSLVGPSGTSGSDGVDGLNVLHGTTDPADAIGVDGEFYINTNTNTLFGPKSSGVWPTGISLIGPTGEAGPAGLLTSGNSAGNTPYWNGTSWIVNSSNIFNNGGNVGVGTSAPAAKLDILGTIKITDGTQGAGKVLTSDANGLASWTVLAGNGWGLQGNSGTIDGTDFIGTTDGSPLNFRVGNQRSGRVDTNGSVFLGYQAGNTGASVGNTGVGWQALYASTTGSQNTAFGRRTLYTNTIGQFNTAVGGHALELNQSGNFNTGTGFRALYANSAGIHNTANGNDALYSNTGSYNTAGGSEALFFNTTGDGNTAYGYKTFTTNKIGNFNTAVGYMADVSSDGLSNATAIGNGARVNSSNSIQLGNGAVTQVFVGVGSNATLTTGRLKVTGGTPGEGKVLTSDASGLASWTSPAITGWSLSGNSANTDGTNFIGTTNNAPLYFKVYDQYAGKLQANGNVFFGIGAGGNTTTASPNIAIGSSALAANTSGYSNVAIGSSAMLSNTTGHSNIAYGHHALFSNTTGFYNTAIGIQALYVNTTGAGNIALGNSALRSNTNGMGNIAIGLSALNANTSGGNNIAIGSESLYSNITGTHNIASGVSSLYANTTGNHNIATGLSTLSLNTAGGYNVAYGTSSLSANTIGSGNTAVGSNSLSSNVTGNNNTAIGYSANVGSDALTNATAIGFGAIVTEDNSIQLGNSSLTRVFAGTGANATLVTGGLQITGGSPGEGKVLTSDASGLASWTTPASTSWGLSGNTVTATNFIGTTNDAPLNFKINNQPAGKLEYNGNVFMGTGAGLNNTGFPNIGIGSAALAANTTGDFNIGVGYTALLNNTTGNNNIAFGHRALTANTTGFYNTAIGIASLEKNTVGTQNTAVGLWALTANTTGSYNTAAGMYSLNANTEGNNNVAFGIGSLFVNTTGSDNTAIGYFAFSSGETYSNSTAIGARAQVTASNMVRIGDANVTSINGAVAFTVVSDARFKKDVNENVAGLPFIMKLRPVTYHLDMGRMSAFMKLPNDVRSKESETAKERILQTGFIAQEVEKAAQELGYDFSGIDKPENESDYYGLRYAEFTVPLVKAVQEQQQMIEHLKAQIALLKNQYEAIIDTLKAENSNLKFEYNERLTKLEAMLNIGAQNSLNKD